MQRYKLCLSYDGSRYCGWQIQPNGMSVQEQVEIGVQQIIGDQIRLHSSGRTDQGVHARCQVAHCDLPKKVCVDTLLKGLNGVLPADIRVQSVTQVPQSFHARFSAKGKEYRYFIWNASVVPPYLRNIRTHIQHPLNIQAMREASVFFIGKNNFAAFSANSKRNIENTIREMRQFRVVKKGYEIVIIAQAEGFLYKMARSLVGFLIRVGEGAILPDEAKIILEIGKRTERVPTAPSYGLFLWNVIY